MPRTPLRIACWLIFAAAPVALAQPRPSAVRARLTPVPFTDVKLTDAFLAPRIETNRTVSIPHDLAWCEKADRMANFEAAAKRPAKWDGKYQGAYSRDSDVYKVIEGASYSLAVHPDPQLDRRLDDIIAKIAAAQQPDGYIDTYHQLVEPGRQWTNLKDKHELYSGGHLIEAAVAHHRATGKNTLLDVAVKFADHVDSLFGPGKRIDVCGHEEIELALIKLYHLTGREKYLQLARFFLDTRGNPAGRPRLYGEYCQDHLPVREQREIGGHAVRAMYLYTAVADAAAVRDDLGFVTAMDAVWGDVTRRKMYLTGGIGPSAKNEGFTVPYDLPNESAYAETCASIGMALWNHRLNLLHADAKYFDVFERALYNGLLSGVSLDGERFFYVNPLASRGAHHRQPWFGTACCPSNVVRFLPSLPGYAYATGENALYVNLFAAGTATVRLNGQAIYVTQRTDYPWAGDVRIDLVAPPDVKLPADMKLFVRIPGWCAGATASLNGAPPTPAQADKGYAAFSVGGMTNASVALDLPMPVERVRCNPMVQANVGRVALQRGPIVYCAESADNADLDLVSVSLPDAAPVALGDRPKRLLKAQTLRATATLVDPTAWSNALYASGPPAGVAPKTREVTFIPYCLWDNRAPGQMVVWIPSSN